jgi:hypothetical protein
MAAPDMDAETAAAAARAIIDSNAYMTLATADEAGAHASACYLLAAGDRRLPLRLDEQGAT